VRSILEKAVKEIVALAFVGDVGAAPAEVDRGFGADVDDGGFEVIRNFGKGTRKLDGRRRGKKGRLRAPAENPRRAHAA